MVTVKAGLATPVLFATETKLIDDFTVSTGYVFIAGRHPESQSRHNRHIAINEVISEKTTDSMRLKKKYKIDIRLGSNRPAVIEGLGSNPDKDRITILGLIRTANLALHQ